VPTNRISRLKRLEIFARDRWLCWYCGIGLAHPDEVNWSEVRNHKNAAVIDHIIPIIRNGDDSDSNLRSACWECNQAKKGRTVNEYRQWLLARTSPHFRAHQHICAVINECETPFDSELGKVRDWLLSQIQTVIFYGEKK
jgi:5-methylcytosine-specific restriction endonuclease McrA